MAKRCTCGVRLEPRNTSGYCRACWARLPLARRMHPDSLRDLLVHVPAPELVLALERQGFSLAITVVDVE